MTPRDRIRPPAVAGTFYPAEPQALARSVDGLLLGHPPATPPPAALLAPHAGYRYSGAIAARAFALVEADVFDTAIVVGPSHVEPFDFTAVFDGDAFATPLGEVAIQRDIARSLCDGASIRLSARGHAAGAGRGEHAIEVMLPFLQRRAPGINLVAITMGSQSPAACVALAGAIRGNVDPARTLVIASSDLSHFHRYDDAVALDSEFCRRVVAMDADALLRGLAEGRCEACGGGPTAVAMLVAGGASARLLAYANSGDVGGDRDSVVGYASVAFTPGGTS